MPKAAFEKVPVPCGRCPNCKLRRVNSWVFRLMQEEKISSSSHFITLTYNTDTVPISKNGFMTLKKSDFQNFMKRLRKLTPGSTLRYYAVGEYGTQNKRPHYHAIVFNCPNPDLYSEAWSLDGLQLGTVHVGTVTGDSVAYTMKYIDKLSQKRLHDRDDRIPEFPLMSKGLGSNYLSNAVVGYHKADLTRLYVTKEGGHRIALPRYYRQKIYNDDEQRKQLMYVQDSMLKLESEEKREYERLYASSGYTFEQWMESRKYGRFKQFYSPAKKTRNL